jgi:hypothetical protein
MSDINPEDVKQFLNSEPTSEVEPLFDSSGNEVKTINYDEIKKAKSAAQQEALETNNNIDQGRSKLFEPDTTSVTSLSPWLFQKEDFIVDATEEDKALYLKSLLNDTNLILTIVLEAGVEMQFRSLTNFDFEVIFEALRKESEAGNITGPAQYASKVQQAAVAMQAMKFGEKALDYVSFNKPYPKLAEAAEVLLTYTKNEMGDWAWAKWQCLVTGLRMFETKLSICNENIRNGNFWHPAGTV